MQYKHNADAISKQIYSVQLKLTQSEVHLVVSVMNWHLPRVGRKSICDHGGLSFDLLHGYDTHPLKKYSQVDLLCLFVIVAFYIVHW